MRLKAAIFGNPTRMSLSVTIPTVFQLELLIAMPVLTFKSKPVGSAGSPADALANNSITFTLLARITPRL